MHFTGQPLCSRTLRMGLRLVGNDSHLYCVPPRPIYPIDDQKTISKPHGSMLVVYDPQNKISVTRWLHNTVVTVASILVAVNLIQKVTRWSAKEKKNVTICQHYTSSIFTIAGWATLIVRIRASDSTASTCGERNSG